MATTVEASVEHQDDVVRDAILRHLYEVHQRAKGPKKVAVGIMDLRRAMKASHGFRHDVVVSNLDYLVQKGWVTEVVTSRSFKTERGTFQNAEQTKYKISAVGLDKLQRASVFQRKATTAGINITNIHGVTVLGDGNVVNTHFTDLSRILADMRTAVQDSPALPDEQKLEIVSDIDTLQAQLQKPKPNKSIVRTLWSGIENTVTAAGFADLCTKAATLIAPLLS